MLEQITSGGEMLYNRDQLKFDDYDRQMKQQLP